jgi:cytochrome c-type protein NapB
VLALLSACALGAIACWPGTQADEPLWRSAPSASSASQQVRQQRRAYDGAPPVIPHQHFDSPCVDCHAGQAVVVHGIGIAPANPHGVGFAADILQRSETVGIAGRTQNCVQCHVPTSAVPSFAGSTFSGWRTPGLRGSRHHPLAPPRIPHDTWLHENCLACHAGPAAREEIITTHPERTACRQCHVAASVQGKWPPPHSQDLVEPPN